MKFALASCGTRGDVEPCAAVGLELLRRGHDVRMAAPSNLLGLVESAGLAAVAYGPDSHEELIPDFFHDFWKMQNPLSPIRRAIELNTRLWAEMSATLMSLADGADLVLTGMIFSELAANVAEYCDIPVAVLHTFPVRVNGHLLPLLPPPLIRSAISTVWWLYRRMTKEAEAAQRRQLGLPKATRSSTQRTIERESLEIQAYDELYFPGLAAEWGGRRPFVGALTMELTTDADDELASWVSAGTPPIYFCFGSMGVESPSDIIEMIDAACAELGERALISSGASDFGPIPPSDRLKVVGAVHYATLFPACRAVVHHGGAGTTAAGMRAGVPTLILWSGADQPLWAAQVKRLGAGSARRFSSTTRKSLVSELRTILAPQYVTRAREIATRMTKPADSVTTTADLLEDAARAGSRGQDV
jgi:UDP:flavonoid glycosyltransferase YjiC (YdhE family)